MQRLAAERGSRIVTIGAGLLFATESGDAWILDPSDHLAARIADTGEPRSIHIVETDKRFEVGWQGRYEVIGPAFTSSSQRTSQAARQRFWVTRLWKSLVGSRMFSADDGAPNGREDPMPPCKTCGNGSRASRHGHVRDRRTSLARARAQKISLACQDEACRSSRSLEAAGVEPEKPSLLNWWRRGTSGDKPFRTINIRYRSNLLRSPAIRRNPPGSWQHRGNGSNQFSPSADSVTKAIWTQ